MMSQDNKNDQGAKKSSPMKKEAKSPADSEVMNSTPDNSEFTKSNTSGQDASIPKNSKSGSVKESYIKEPIKAAVKSSKNNVISDDNSDQKTSRSVLNIIGFALIATLLLSLIVGGYWGWMQYQQQITTFTQQYATLQEELQVTKNQLTTLKAADQESAIKIDRELRQIESLVVSSAQTLNRQANRNENRWPLEEALTLIRLANQRLQLDADASVAVGLLKASDLVLSEMDQAAMLPFRRQIASDILALESTPAADVNGHYFMIEAISKEVRELEWVVKPSQRETIPNGANPIEGFWQSLKQVVVITKLDVPLQALPLRTDFERWRQQQLLILQQVQLALLARNQLLFDAALNQSVASLAVMQSQFDFSVLSGKLASLKSAVLNPVWPDVGLTAVLIERFLSEATPSAISNSTGTQIEVTEESK